MTGTPAGQSASPLSSAVLPVADKIAPPLPAATVSPPSPSATPTPPAAPAPSASAAPKKAATTTTASAAHAEDVSKPDKVIGDGTPGSCRPSALAAAVDGGGIYSDGTSESVTVDGFFIQGSHATEGGPSVLQVSNDRTGSLVIKNTRIIGNSGQSFFKVSHRSIYYLGNGPIQISGSTVE